MIHASDAMPTIIAVGLILAAALLAKAFCERLRVPRVAGYLLLGIAGASIDARFGGLGGREAAIIGLLGQFGVIVLLFSVGMRSKLRSLLNQLSRAGPIWILNMLVAGRSEATIWSALPKRTRLGWKVVCHETDLGGPHLVGPRQQPGIAVPARTGFRDAVPRGRHAGPVSSA